MVFVIGENIKAAKRRVIIAGFLLPLCGLFASLDEVYRKGMADLTLLDILVRLEMLRGADIPANSIGALDDAEYRHLSVFQHHNVIALSKTRFNFVNQFFKIGHLDIPNTFLFTVRTAIAVRLWVIVNLTLVGA